MFSGAHVVLYSRNPDADRAFFRDVLGFRAVDAGRGWLIFALPPAEAALHPTDNGPAPNAGDPEMLVGHIYLMCDNLKSIVASLETRGVTCGEIATAPWGIRTTIPLPGGGMIGLYQPTHPTAI